MGGLSIMIDLKELKNIVDTNLKDISVSDALKEKTLIRLHKKETSWTRKALVPSACAAALIVAIGANALYQDRNSPPKTISSSNRINTMAAADNTNTAQAPDNTFAPEVQVLESWKVETMEDAKKYMDGAVLTPSYVPENSILKEIIAAGPTIGDAISIMMEFELEGRPFTITQDKNVAVKMNPVNSKEVDINGVKAFVNSNKFDNGETTIYSTTVRWYKGNSMYAVQGAISEEEAIKVAQSLK